MPFLSNDEINQKAGSNYSDEFLNMMRQWYAPDKHIVRDTEQLLLQDISSKNVRFIMFEYVGRYLSLQGKSLLEVGCGTGQNIEFWHKAGVHDITSLDIDKFAVTLTKRRCLDLGITPVEVFHGDFLTHGFNQ